MKKLIFTFALLLLNAPCILACELCRKNQPKILQNITHDSGPTGMLDYIIIWSVIVTVTLILSIKFLVRPSETGSEHIKNIVLNPNS